LVPEFGGFAAALAGPADRNPYRKGPPISREHLYQLVVSKTFAKIDFRATLGHVTTEASLAKIDPDAGLPTPEAPRLIVNALGTINHLPFGLQARAEFEEVGAKPLGDGFKSVPVRECRGALVRPFLQQRMDVGVNFLVASGFAGRRPRFSPQVIKARHPNRSPGAASFLCQCLLHVSLPAKAKPVRFRHGSSELGKYLLSFWREGFGLAHGDGCDRRTERECLCGNAFYLDTRAEPSF
jgi:hypothetical protein